MNRRLLAPVHLSGALCLCLPLLIAVAPAAEFDHTHSQFAAVLQQSLKGGLVDYPGLKASPKQLNAYLDSLDAVAEGDFAKWTQDQQLAFLINLYNASVLRLIIDHYPVKSIKKIGGFFRQPWDVDVVPYFGKVATLGYLEHEVIRKNYREPRVHFALVCAALGCPELRPEPYQPGKLDRQLTEQGQNFLRNPAKNRIDLRARVAHLSPIFKWFATDFGPDPNAVVAFVLPFVSADVQEKAKGMPLKIRYTDYDWSLNELPARKR